VQQRDCGRTTLGKEVGEAGTDSALIAVCDIHALDAVIGDQAEAFQQLIESAIQSDCGLVEVRLNGVCMMPYVPSGFGDGTGPVFELRSKRKVVGMELEFIAPDFTFEVEEKRPEDDHYEKIGALMQAGACIQCSGSGQCYCIRKGTGNSADCVRCNGSGKCRVCGGKGKR
jgi:hypothetical protein